MTNLLNVFNGPYASPEFNKVNEKDFLDSIKRGIQLAKERIHQIKIENNPTFENTIEKLDYCSHELGAVSSLFYNLFSAHTTDYIQSIAPEVSKLHSEFSNDISLDKELFDKIKSVYKTIDRSVLNIEQKTLLENTYKSFVRNGAMLDENKKSELRKIDEELAPLSSKFSENVLKATNNFEMYIEESELEGLPDSFLEASAEAAKEKSKEGKYLVSLHAPSLIPFLTYSKNRELREKLWRAQTTKCIEGELSNKNIIKKSVELKHKRAKLLGYASYADYVLEERMAKKPMAVKNFLQDLTKASKPAALKDVEEVRAYAKKDGIEEVMPWDFAYYSEKLKEDKYGFNEEELRPYFSLENVERGVFDLASKLYSIDFKQVTNISTYHKDVRTYEVYDKDSKEVVGLFFADYFPRDSKRSGAWMTSYRDQQKYNSKNQIPIISIVCNFTKPTATKPSLLTFDEVSTLFHEFGHALHGLLSKCTYPSLSGTNVYWDFVELPSQFMENFLREKEVLDLFAEHYQTKEKIPADLVEKLKTSLMFQAGYFCMRQLNFATLDMAWYESEAGLNYDVLDFENKVTQETQVLPRIAGTSSSCSFAHIFAGGYAAGYYSYKWAEVLDADAFEAFKEAGLFNREIAKSFKDNILSRGGSEDPMVLYKRFRGREPDPKALLRRDGLI